MFAEDINKQPSVMTKIGNRARTCVMQGRQHSVVFWQCPPASWGLLCIHFPDRPHIPLRWRPIALETSPASAPDLCTGSSCSCSLRGLLAHCGPFSAWRVKEASSRLSQNSSPSNPLTPVFISLPPLHLTFETKSKFYCVWCVFSE